jgi:cobalamin synthase
MRYAYGLLAVSMGVLAGVEVLLGWILDWPWMYAIAGLLVVSSGALIWRIRHPEAPAATHHPGDEQNH